MYKKTDSVIFSDLIFHFSKLRIFTFDIISNKFHYSSKLLGDQTCFFLFFNLKTKFIQIPEVKMDLEMKKGQKLCIEICINDGAKGSKGEKATSRRARSKSAKRSGRSKSRAKKADGMTTRSKSRKSTGNRSMSRNRSKAGKSLQMKKENSTTMKSKPTSGAGKRMPVNGCP